MARKPKSENPSLVERWDLKALSMTDATEVQSALEEGYEPFSVSSLMKKNETVLSSASSNGMTVETIIWMKRRHLVPLTDGSETKKLSVVE
jgi:hypothetical protein